MPEEFCDVVDEFIDIQQIQQNAVGLEKIAHGIGYGGNYNSTTLEDFFNDNPGAVEAVIDWIKEQDNDDWKEFLEAWLPPKEDEEE